MDERPKLGLENPTHRARLRGRGLTNTHTLSSPHHAQNLISDVRIHSRSINKHASDIKAVAQPVTSRHLPKQAKSRVLKRQVTRPIYAPYPKHRRPVRAIVWAVVVILLAAGGTITVFTVMRRGSEAKAQAKQLSSQIITDATSQVPISEAEPPKDITTYQVAADLPRFLSIEKIDVHARIRQVSEESKNVPTAPASIFDVGWYNGSPKPGEPGTIVLDGHVSGPTKRGVFYNIGNMQIGDKITLERGDGKVFSYTVSGKELYDNGQVDTDKLVKSSVPGKPGLNLITSSGRFNVRDNQFEQRMVIFAVQD